jgi:hypothetical protein
MRQDNIYKFLREACFFFGFFSITASIFFWFNPVPLDLNKLHQEHVALFVGLWSPTFFALSLIFDKMVDKRRK